MSITSTGVDGCGRPLNLYVRIVYSIQLLSIWVVVSVYVCYSGWCGSSDIVSCSMPNELIPSLSSVLTMKSYP